MSWFQFPCLEVSSMSLLHNVMAVTHGRSSKFRVGNSVTVCSVDGCMAEQLNPVYAGVIVRKVEIPLANADRTLPGIEIRVTQPMKSGEKIGAIRTERVDRLKSLETGALIVAN